MSEDLAILYKGAIAKLSPKHGDVLLVDVRAVNPQAIGRMPFVSSEFDDEHPLCIIAVVPREGQSLKGAVCNYSLDELGVRRDD